MAHQTISPSAQIFSALESMSSDEQSIRQELISYVLDTYIDDDEIQNFFHDLLSHGCVSGMIPFLIYYHDTHEFFDRHYDEIEDLRREYEDNIGEPLTIRYDLKNHLAWFAFEQTAYELANELGIEW